MTSNRAARTEGIIQVLILLFMGIMAGAASFRHIHDVTVAHGQPSWIGWTNAIVIERCPSSPDWISAAANALTNPPASS